MLHTCFMLHVCYMTVYVMVHGGIVVFCVMYECLLCMSGICCVTMICCVAGLAMGRRRQFSAAPCSKFN